MINIIPIRKSVCKSGFFKEILKLIQEKGLSVFTQPLFLFNYVEKIFITL